MRENRHEAWELKQYQSLSLESKIQLTKERIKAWYDAWKRFEICNDATGKTRYVTIDSRDRWVEPKMKDTEWVKSAWPGQVYVSVSGKDSTVLKHIVDSMYQDVPAVFVNTGLEYPEVQRFWREVKAGKYGCFNPDVEIIRPELRFDEVLKQYGYPVVSKEVSQVVREARIGLDRGDGSYANRIKKLQGTYTDKNGEASQFNMEKWGYLLDAPFEISEQCCAIMKKNPAKQYEMRTGRKAIIGTMAQESRLRHQRWLRYGCNAFDIERPTSNPISFWTEQDVLHYIKKFNVPYCDVYGDIVVKPHGKDVQPGQIDLLDYLGEYDPSDLLETTGYKRTGCMFCMFGCHIEKEKNRFQTMKETHPHQYKYCINGGEMVDGKLIPNKDGLGLGKVLDFIGVEYE